MIGTQEVNKMSFLVVIFFFYLSAKFSYSLSAVHYADFNAKNYGRHWNCQANSVLWNIKFTFDFSVAGNQMVNLIDLSS